MNLPAPPPPPPESWVNIVTLSKHLSVGRTAITRMVRDGQIPSFSFGNGKKTYLRFKISEVDAAMMRGNVAL